MMMYFIFLLILGLFLLYFGGELLVRASISLALKMRVSTLVIGMTIVAFATSAPELFVSLQALVFENNSNIVLGNVIGSNITNIGLVLAVTALIFRVDISDQTIKIHYPVLLFSTVIFGCVLYYFNSISQNFGILFVLLLFFFCYFLIYNSRKYNIKEESDGIIFQQHKDGMFKTVFFLLAGIFLLKYGADSLVRGAVLIAEDLGVSDKVIAVTIIAIGTSIPELATSIVAALKKEENLAFGNLIGSNIFNILAVLGVSSIVKNILVKDVTILNFDYMAMLIITLVIGCFIYFFSKKVISSIEGGVLLIIYILYIIFTLN